MNTQYQKNAKDLLSDYVISLSNPYKQILSIKAVCLFFPISFFGKLSYWRRASILNSSCPLRSVLRCRLSWHYAIFHAFFLFLPYHVKSRTGRDFGNVRVLQSNWLYCYWSISKMHLLESQTEIRFTFDTCWSLKLYHCPSLKHL